MHRGFVQYFPPGLCFLPGTQHLMGTDDLQAPTNPPTSPLSRNFLSAPVTTITVDPRRRELSLGASRHSCSACLAARLGRLKLPKCWNGEMVAFQLLYCFANLHYFFCNHFPSQNFSTSPDNESLITDSLDLGPWLLNLMLWNDVWSPRPGMKYSKRHFVGRGSGVAFSLTPQTEAQLLDTVFVPRGLCFYPILWTDLVSPFATVFLFPTTTTLL